MGLVRALSAFVKKRTENPWEVVDSKDVEPVPVWDDDDGPSDSLHTGTNRLS